MKKAAMGSLLLVCGLLGGYALGCGASNTATDDIREDDGDRSLRAPGTTADPLWIDARRSPAESGGEEGGPRDVAERVADEGGAASISADGSAAEASSWEADDEARLSLPRIPRIPRIPRRARCPLATTALGTACGATIAACIQSGEHGCRIIVQACKKAAEYWRCACKKDCGGSPPDAEHLHAEE